MSQDVWATVLDEHERQMAERCGNASKRLEFMKSHWLLRTILSGYVEDQAGSIRLAYRDKGKPYLPDHTLYFSLSHSHDVWLLALTTAGDIGADIEKLVPIEGMDAIIRRYLHRDEREKLSGLDPQRKIRAFYQIWTQLEAFVKMHGLGLHAKMSTIRRTALGLVFEADEGAWAACESYSVHSDYMASIAVEGSMPPVVMMEWTPDKSNCERGVELPCLTQIRASL
jgi:phosphopantetheinyl transferase